jgi:hypothetical protein
MRQREPVQSRTRLTLAPIPTGSRIALGWIGPAAQEATSAHASLPVDRMGDIARGAAVLLAFGGSSPRGDQVGRPAHLTLADRRFGQMQGR